MTKTCVPGSTSTCPPHEWGGALRGELTQKRRTISPQGPSPLVGRTGGGLGKSLRLSAFALFALSTLPLAACSFSPVYGGGQGAAFANAGPIAINEIRAVATAGAASGRTGHFLRQELVRSVGQGVPGFSTGTLDVALQHGIERLAFAPDQAASRSDYIGNATWTLRGSNGAILGTGSVQERASFNFADAAYADLAAQTAAQERLATLLARSIRAEMIIAGGKTVDPKTGTPVPAVAPAQ